MRKALTVLLQQNHQELVKERFYLKTAALILIAMDKSLLI